MAGLSAQGLPAFLSWTPKHITRDLQHRHLNCTGDPARKTGFYSRLFGCVFNRVAPRMSSPLAFATDGIREV